MATFYETVMSRRTIRRFTQKPIPREDLVALVKAGSYAPSAGNGQPWQFIIVDDPPAVKALTECLGWLGGSPPPEQAPVAHVAVLLTNPKAHWAQFADAGSAIQTISLVAWEKGIGSCWFGSIQQDQARDLLQVPTDWLLVSVLSLGYPDESPVVEEVAEKPRARRGANGVLTVQKRALDSILHFNQFGRRT